MLAPVSVIAGVVATSTPWAEALRRVRAVSPANRSDGYLGSDLSGENRKHIIDPLDYVLALTGPWSEN